MAYVEEFRSQIEKRDFSKIMQLWQEYCLGDQVDGQEIIDILVALKNSDFAKPFGQYVEAMLPLALAISDDSLKAQALTLIIDLQTSNSQPLYDLCIDFIKSRFETLPHFNEKMRLVGLRTKDNFQGALSAFQMLNHFQKGNFVLHTSGWGVGKIIDCSFLREQLTLEFENLNGSKRDLLFKNAFKTVQTLPSDHILVLRYESPEVLEKMVKDDPVRVIHQIIRDLGPKSAADIKEILLGSIIDEKDYSKWWQNTRAKIKKEPLIEKPEQLKEPYRIRSEGIKHDHLVEKAIKGKKNFDDIISILYSLTREYPELLKVQETKDQITHEISSHLKQKDLSTSTRIKANLFLDSLCGIPTTSVLQELIKSVENVEELVLSIDVQLLKRRLLVVIKNCLANWPAIFAKLLLVIEPNQVKDYVLKELTTNKHLDIVEKTILDLADHPIRSPNTLLWFYQRQLDNDVPLLADQPSREKFTESCFILLNQLEKLQNQGNPEAKELVKKIYLLITEERFHTVRLLLKGSSEQFARELLLLTSKCHSFTDHDQKIIKALIDVVHKGLSKQEPDEESSEAIFWATPASYTRTKKKIEHLGTVEVVDNAKEIEAARALGDLRENAEYKSALERRSRLQSEIRTLSDQFNSARLITAEDIDTSQVGIGTKVTLRDPKGKKIVYTILGPWDADPDKSILSPQSKFVQSMVGKKLKESFSFKDESYTVEAIESYLG